MNPTVIINILRFILLLTAQVLVFSNINFLGYINPYPYILFVLLYPVNGNKSSLLLSSFALGLLIDLFSDSGGIHATATTFLAYIRPNLFRFSFGISYEYQTIRVTDKITSERVLLLLIAILIHHSILFSLEIFRIDLFFLIFTKTLFSTISTFIVSLLIIFLIKNNNR